MQNDGLLVVGAEYALETGVVEFLRLKARSGAPSGRPLFARLHELA